MFTRERNPGTAVVAPNIASVRSAFDSSPQSGVDRQKSEVTGSRQFVSAASSLCRGMRTPLRIRTSLIKL
ncbi:hypothetical protein Ciccas_009800 [Cichlidogyrus casuarinus]|uniref:Uncharacterized protein n=1 Tax=Cichlidogyrus casuarinus TaxID=1844966 RepID=A0ABD2PVZ1_9PLAT